MIRITKPNGYRQIRLKSITVEFSYDDAEAKTVSSVVLSGAPTQTEYYTNQSFNSAGLAVTAYYTDGTNADVTSQSTFECNPATFITAGAQTVTVKAKYNDIYSNERTYNVTVAELTGDTYTLVTSKDELESGAKYVLLTSDGARAASDYSDKKITTVAATDGAFSLTDNVVTVNSDAVNVFNLTGNKTDGWKISDSAGNKFGSSKADINTVDATYTIDFVSEIVSIVDKTTTTREWLLQRYSTSGTSTTPTNVIKNYASSNADQKDYCTLKLYKSNAQVVVKPDAPTFNPVSGTAFDTETATVTITAPAGCTLKYTVGSGEEQTSSSNTAEVTVSPTAYTITAKSVDADGVESNEATATYTFNVVAHVKNIAEFMALKPNATAIFDNPVVVLYDYSQPSLKKTDGQYLSNPEYIWVKDESGQTNLYLEEAINPTNHQAKYENGDVIPAGFKAVKNYFSDGNFYQALVDIDNKSLLADASHKRLADPVTITFDQFNGLVTGVSEKALADSAQWSNTYVMIQNVTMSADASDSWDKTYFVYQDGVKATSNVFYNKYSDTRNETEIPLTKQGEDGRVSMPSVGATKQYNVYGILQVYNNIWEIMPIRFVEYSAQTVTLKELVQLGNVNKTDVNTEYTILNDLLGVRALSGNVILAKDENGNAVDKVTPAGNSFMINAKSKFDDAATEESVNAKAQEDYDQSNWVEIVLPSSVSAADYVDKIITGLSVKGYYKNTTNPRLEASAAPTAGGATGAYTRNAMCPANFMGTSQACNAEQNHGDFFFMTPKPNECVQVVWAVYNSTAKAFYIPAAQGSINSHGFKGAFSIDWAYNADGKITNLTDGNLYQFAAVVKKIEPGPRSPKRKVAYVNNQPLSSDYVVFPLNLDANYVTGITETTGAKTVKSVRYFNIMGVELAEPTAGVNIVLTTYTDGTTHSQKILK
ncbi:MAG: bacterial Ig-like domain-containing protein [bacterium]|nr:bacterial Ig-like domain-containing protein [bacterium]